MRTNITRGTVAFACLAVASCLLYAGGRGDVHSLGVVSESAIQGWDFSSFETGVYQNAKYEAVFLAGSGVVHEFTITAMYKPQTWTFSDSDRLDDPAARKICTLVLQPGETAQLSMDVRVRRGVVGRVNEGTQATVTVTFLAD